jgi:hypothetical protein
LLSYGGLYGKVGYTTRYDCPRCKRKTDALKGQGLQKVPYVLTMNLMRCGTADSECRFRISVTAYSSTLCPGIL